MNQQPSESSQHAADGALDVHSIFSTIQGEGPFAGTPAIFLRLAGCNLQCPWCDTDYTSRRMILKPADIVRMILDLNVAAKLVVITGGEPFRQNMRQVVHHLVANDYRVQVETNGTLHDVFFPFSLATIVCSPKTPRVHPRLEPYLAALKYVLDADHVDPDDGLPSSTMGTDHRVYRPGMDFTGEIYVQPLDVSGNLTGAAFVGAADNVRHTAAAVASAVKYGYRLCIQTHKLTGLE